jgi:hypothetical protein
MKQNRSNGDNTSWEDPSVVSPTSVVSPHNPNEYDESPTVLTIQVDYNSAVSAQRFPAWMALAVFSCICLVALQSRRGIFNVDNAGEVWVLIVTILSLILGLVAVLSYLVARTYVVGQTPELVLAGIALALWAAGLPVIMNPSNDIAVSRPTTTAVAPVVTNANLYLFAWLSFAVTIYLAANIGHEWYNKYLNHSNIQSGNGNYVIPVVADPTKVGRWCGITAALLVVLGAAIRTFQSASCRTGTDEDQDGNVDTRTEFCRRTTFAIALGLISMLMSAAMTYLLLKQQPSGRALSLRAEMSIATLQLLLWCFGVSFVTFGKGPGSTIGNLYLSTWITFILAVVIFAVSFRECVASRAAAAAAAQEQNGSSNTGPPSPEFDHNL